MTTNEREPGCLPGCRTIEAAHCDSDHLPDCPKAKAPEPVKRERNAALLAAQERISGELNAARVGSVEEVLVEGVSKNDPSRLTGRTRGNSIVVFPGAPSDGLEGKLVDARIVASTPLTLIGERAPSGGISGKTSPCS